MGAQRVRIVHSVILRRKAPRGSRTGPGNGKGGNPKNDRTPSPQPKSEKPCFLHAKGKCDRSDCLYKHDNEAAPAESGSAKAKAAAPKGKAKAAAAKAKSAAVVVEVKGPRGRITMVICPPIGPMLRIRPRLQPVGH